MISDYGGTAGESVALRLRATDIANGTAAVEQIYCPYIITTNHLYRSTVAKFLRPLGVTAINFLGTKTQAALNRLKWKVRYKLVFWQKRLNNITAKKNTKLFNIYRPSIYCPRNWQSPRQIYKNKMLAALRRLYKTLGI